MNLIGITTQLTEIQSNKNQSLSLSFTMLSFTMKARSCNTLKHYDIKRFKLSQLRPHFFFNIG